MADIKDISAVIASALEEVNVAGTLDVKMDGEETIDVLHGPVGEDVKVTVTVERASES